MLERRWDVDKPVMTLSGLWFFQKAQISRKWLFFLPTQCACQVLCGFLSYLQHGFHWIWLYMHSFFPLCKKHCYQGEKKG
jgi:hypothetical protein